MNLKSLLVGEKTNPRTTIRRVNPTAMLFVVGTFGLAVSSFAQVNRLPASGAADAPAQSTGPKIEFASPVFDFGKVKQGQLVRHDFVVRNTGTAVLEIMDVHPGCGCTTTGNWDRRVEPGKTGIIPLELNSAGFSGAITKIATVTCNDPRQPTVNLQIKGEVWSPISVSPTIVVFTGSSETETSETKVVRITSQLDEPVTLSGVEGTTAAFRTDLITMKPGKDYELKISTVPPFPSASTSAFLTMKTASPDMPTITVLAQLIVQQPVVATPERITLPRGPLSAATNVVVTIRNNGKNALALSDPKINVPGAEVSVQEIQAAKLFQIEVKFPAGFEPKTEGNFEVSVKSNHPKLGIIRVPVVAAQPVAVPAKASG